MKSAVRFASAVFALVALGSGCKGAPESAAAPAVDPAHKAAVEAALQKYCDYVARMDDKGIAEMFTADGEMGSPGGKPLVGREAILRHLATLHDFKVESTVVTSESVTFRGSEAHQKGTYKQTVLTPKGNTLIVSGKLEADWTLEKDGVWRLKKMIAAPDAFSKPKE
jgi:uncharacterized protein (TIGR02246 family)